MIFTFAHGTSRDPAAPLTTMLKYLSNSPLAMIRVISSDWTKLTSIVVTGVATVNLLRSLSLWMVQPLCGIAFCSNIRWPTFSIVNRVGIDILMTA
jgi:hypothetical protein